MAYYIQKKIESLNELIQIDDKVKRKIKNQVERIPNERIPNEKDVPFYLYNNLKHYSNLEDGLARNKHGMYYKTPEELNLLKNLSKAEKESLALQADDADNIIKYAEIQNKKQAPLFSFIKNEFSTEENKTQDEIDDENKKNYPDGNIVFKPYEKKRVKLIDKLTKTLSDDKKSLTEKIDEGTKILNKQLTELGEINTTSKNNNEKIDTALLTLKNQLDTLNKISRNIGDPEVQGSFINIISNLGKTIEEQKEIVSSVKGKEKEEEEEGILPVFIKTFTSASQIEREEKKQEKQSQIINTNLEKNLKEVAERLSYLTELMILKEEKGMTTPKPNILPYTPESITSSHPGTSSSDDPSKSKMFFNINKYENGEYTEKVYAIEKLFPYLESIYKDTLTSGTPIPFTTDIKYNVEDNEYETKNHIYNFIMGTKKNPQTYDIKIINKNDSSVTNIKIDNFIINYLFDIVTPAIIEKYIEEDSIIIKKKSYNRKNITNLIKLRKVNDNPENKNYKMIVEMLNIFEKSENELYKKIVEESDEFKGSGTSGVEKKKPKKKGKGMVYYSNPNELKKRLELVIGTIGAKNASKELINEGFELIDTLLKIKQINKKTHKKLFDFLIKNL